MDLVVAVEVFSDSTLNEVQMAVEMQLIQNMRLLVPELASDLLYKLTKQNLGTRSLMTATLKRVELDSHMIVDLQPETMCQSLIALNLAGTAFTKEEFNAYAEGLASEQALGQLSSEERNVLASLCNTVMKETRQA